MFCWYCGDSGLLSGWWPLLVSVSNSIWLGDSGDLGVIRAGDVTKPLVVPE